MPVVDVDKLCDERVDALRRFHQHARVERAELDVSGGIDSAVMAGLLVLALGADKVTMVYSSIHSGAATRDRAVALARGLEAPLIIHELTPTYESMVQAMVENLVNAGWARSEIERRIREDNTVLGSIRSCLRAPLGRGYLRLTGNGIRHGTGNECEDRWLRFYQKGGDGEVDTNPIAMLSKGEVYQLAVGLGQRLDCSQAYAAIVGAPPTPELWGSETQHTDEEEIGSHLGVATADHRFYSYVDAETGRYQQVGLIERVSRFSDTVEATGLFVDGTSSEQFADLIIRAQTSAAFTRVEPDVVAAMLRAARRVERNSRHKFNPNCPTLGDRKTLVKRAILTNAFPEEIRG